MTGDPVLQLHDVTRVYQRGEVMVRALTGVTLEVSGGELVAVMGPSPGCPPVRMILQGNGGEAAIGSGFAGTASRRCEAQLGAETEFNNAGLDSPVLVATGTTAAALVGGRFANPTRAALDAGRAVAFSPGPVGEGRLDLVIGGRHQRSASMPAVDINDPAVPSTVAAVILPPSEATRLRVGVGDATIYVKHATRLPDRTLAAANAALVRLGLDPLFVEPGFQNSLNRQLLIVAGADLALTIAAAVTSTALVSVDNQADLFTLEALGGGTRPPAPRRRPRRDHLPARRALRHHRRVHPGCRPRLAPPTSPRPATVSPGTPSISRGSASPR